MIRLIATDLDDTLLNASSDLTDRTRRALHAAMEAGIGISLSSGRMVEAMVPIAQRIGVNAPMILFNGALIYDHRTNETLYRNAIPMQTAAAVAKALEDMNIYVQAYPGKGYYCNAVCEHTKRYEKSIRVKVTPLGVPVSGWIHEDCIKMLAIDTPDGIDTAAARLREMFPHGVSFMKSKPHYLEIVASGIDKGVALERLGASMGVSRSEIMAFGDGQNDAPMLAYAGTGVAMENAVEECKRVAQVIAPKNTQDGVASIIEEMLSGGNAYG